jgi:metal-dependent hydrolase (beta-lactamase superfamily II)
MKLKVLSTGSVGNCYILENENEALVIDAGVRFLDIKKAVNFDLGKMNGALISHEHL